ncbi:hypothetical protein ACEQPO_23980 [Bacillus sp. SL00103]
MAGTTGSGKVNFYRRTFYRLLYTFTRMKSLFLLIDYKGGGMA